MPVKKVISKETLINLYIVQRKTLDEICEILDVKSPITIRKRMKEYGIQRRDTNKERSLIYNLGIDKEQFEKEIRILYLEKLMSINEIARKYNVTSVVIRRRLKEFKIPLRNRKEANALNNSGSKNPKWNGGKRTHSDGYIQLLMPDHPNADGCGYVYEHRYVMECFLGRNLETNEHVHHINENKADNRIENLQVLSPAEHAKLHAPNLIKARLAKRS